MPRFVNPMIDSAFKALFANPQHSFLLVDLLNAVVQTESPIVSVEYLDPVDGPDRIDGRGTAVDVKVRDRIGRLYQVEVQVVLHPAIAERIALTWSRMYDRQINRGDSFEKLGPVTAVWIMDRRFRPGSELHRHYAFRDRKGALLTEHCNIHVLELCNLPSPDLEDPLETWLYFLKKAREWENLPHELDRSPFSEAMQVMKRFSQDDAQYYRYIAELDAEMEKLTFERAKQSYEDAMESYELAMESHRRVKDALVEVEAKMEQAIAAADNAVAEKERAQEEKERAQAEKDRVLRDLADREAEVARLRALLELREE